MPQACAPAHESPVGPAPYAGPSASRRTNVRGQAPRVAQRGSPFLFRGFAVGANSFPVLAYGKGGVRRPRFRLCFLYLPRTFTFVRISK